MLVSDRLRTAFVMALGLEDGVDVLEIRHQEDSRWDSLGHLALILAIEEEFDVLVDSDHLLAMDSFPKALEILADLGVTDEYGASVEAGG
jgi:acyl carrier protein